MENYVVRKPEFTITFLRPNYFDSSKYEETVRNPIFQANSDNEYLVDYNYEQSIDGFDCPFTMNFVPEEVTVDGKTIEDVIEILDLVKIEEFEEVKYIGVVNSIRTTSRMDESGPVRRISVSGYGIGGILDRFQLLLDQVVLADAGKTIESMNRALSIQNAELSARYGVNATLFNVFSAIKSSFYSAASAIGGFEKNTGLLKLVDQYLDFSEDSKRLTTKYPVAISVFSYGANTLGDIWRSFITKPLYEMFARWEESQKKWLIVMRPTPYDADAWLNLHKTEIDPVYLERIDLGYSDADVKTWFFAYLSGGAMTAERTRYLYQNQAIKKSGRKWSLFGFQPMESQFRYFDEETFKENGKVISPISNGVKGDVSGQDISDAGLMAKYAEKLEAWFGRADEMLSGTIEMKTMKNGPRVGERVQYRDVQAYVQTISGSWRYGDSMVTTLQVIRGGVYNENVKSGKVDFKKPSRLSALTRM